MIANRARRSMRGMLVQGYCSGIGEGALRILRDGPLAGILLPSGTPALIEPRKFADTRFSFDNAVEAAKLAAVGIRIFYRADEAPVAVLIVNN